MNALFITTDTNDCLNHYQAWNSCFTPALLQTFNIHQIRNDWKFVQYAQKMKPDVIFYIGAVKGLGIPKPDTFKQLRDIAPTINLCSDAADSPWHGVLKHYKKQGCFDLQVSIDGALDAPVDHVTLTPVSPEHFKKETKDIRCGFSGTVGRFNRRSEVINALEWFGNLTVRKRGDSHREHINFLNRCELLLNTSWTGSDLGHHIKGRVLEAGLAGCALLEHKDSPIHQWFKGGWIPWEAPKDVAEIIKDISDKEIQDISNTLSQEVKSYTPEKIYTEILNLVSIAVEKQTA